MIRFLARRCLVLIPTWLAISFVIFLAITFVPGDPVRAILGPGAAVSRESVEKIRKELGLDKPFLTRYWMFLRGMFSGDLGRSWRSGLPVWQEIVDRLKPTVQLCLSSVLWAAFSGITLGIISALKRGSWVDNLSLVSSVVWISIPGFWFAMILIWVFAVWLRLVPVAGTQSWKTLILPTVVLAMGPTATITRLTRVGMLDVLGSDFVRTARAKGLAERVVIVVHALRNCLIPVITLLGIVFARLMGGALLIEQVFARPGLGRLAVQAIYWRDMPLVQGVTMFVATILLGMNLLVDILYAVLDPRIHLE